MRVKELMFKLVIYNIADGKIVGSDETSFFSTKRHATEIAREMMDDGDGPWSDADISICELVRSTITANWQISLAWSRGPFALCLLSVGLIPAS
jgi:hypothetical protein